MGYKKPLLSEVYAQVIFKEPFAFGDVLNLLQLLRSKKRYCEVELHQQRHIQLAGDLIASDSNPLFFCWNSQRNQLVQLSSIWFGYNQTGDYLGWDSFQKEFGQLLADYQGQLPAPQQVSFSMQDILNTQEPEFRVGTYLNCGGPVIPALFQNVETACDIALGSGVPTLGQENVQVRAEVRLRAKKAQINLNYTLVNPLTEWSQLQAVLESQHQKSVQLFEDSITDATRALMGGKQ